MVKNRKEEMKQNKFHSGIGINNCSLYQQTIVCSQFTPNEKNIENRKNITFIYLIWNIWAFLVDTLHFLDFYSIFLGTKCFSTILVSCTFWITSIQGISITRNIFCFHIKSPIILFFFTLFLLFYLSRKYVHLTTFV